VSALVPALVLVQAPVLALELVPVLASVLVQVQAVALRNTKKKTVKVHSAEKQ
jgi:hypothetical protein